MQGMTNVAADKAGFSIWSVVWEQEVRIGLVPVNNYGPLTNVQIGLAPNVGTPTDYVPV